MGDFFGRLFDASDFMARWECGLWSPGHGWLHILSDTAIWGAYMAIPLVIAFFTIRRKDIPYPRIMWLFVAFIMFCGFTHLIDAGIFWWPAYRFSGVMKLATAAVSWCTVIALVQIVPAALRLPGLARANRDLERANKDLDAFASIVSHDLKAPLRAISSLAAWAEEDAGDLAPQSREHLEGIRARVRRMDQLIDGILEYSRSGRTDMPIETVDAHAAARQVIEALDIPEGMTVRIEGALPTLSANMTMVQQNFQNLIGNALRHMGKADGEVVVACAEERDVYVFTVRDNGTGIDEGEVRDIFRMFRTGSGSATAGTGVGLAIVKKNAETMGGRAWVTSKKGAGAAFHFSVAKDLYAAL